MSDDEPLKVGEQVYLVFRHHWGGASLDGGPYTVEKERMRGSKRHVLISGNWLREDGRKIGSPYSAHAMRRLTKELKAVIQDQADKSEAYRLFEAIQRVRHLSEEHRLAALPHLRQLAAVLGIEMEKQAGGKR